MDNIFTTSTGVEVKIRPISIVALRQSELGLERSYRERNELIDPPTYEVETASGEKVNYVHDEASIQETNDSSITELWTKYQDAKSRLSRDRAALFMDYVMNDAVKIELPQDTAWIEKQKRRFVDIPSDPAELLQHYINTEVLVNGQDFKDITFEVLKISMKGSVNEEALEAALSSFRG